MDSDNLPFYTTARHPEHNVSWMLVSRSHSGVICVACVIEQMEDSTHPLVQRRVSLSLLVNLLKDGEVAVKFRDNMLLSRHVVDIITDQFFTDNHYIGTAVEACKSVLESVQCEDLLWYTVDKFNFQLRSSGDLASTSPYLLLYGQLLTISPAYGFHMLDRHEPLLLLICRLLLETHDESCQCSVIYIFIHLMDEQLRSDISERVEETIRQVLVALLGEAETIDLRVNLLALLKKILSQASTPCVRSLLGVTADNRSLLMGLKKMFISKQELLQTAGAQCVLGLLNTAGDDDTVRQILDSDLAEFLFESLHTQNGPQLNAVYQCLQTLTMYDQFFTRCHSVYGVESILRSIGQVMEMKNHSLAERGFCLLACVLDRQPVSVPLFVNVTSVNQCVGVVKEGVAQGHREVALQALHAAHAFIKHQYIPWPSSCPMIQDIVSRVSNQLSGHNYSSAHRHGSSLDQLLTTFSELISMGCRLYSEHFNKATEDESSIHGPIEETIVLLVSTTETHILPLIMAMFTETRSIPMMGSLLESYCSLARVCRERTQHMSVQLAQMGVLTQAHLTKSRLSDPDLAETVNSFLQTLYQHLIIKSTPFISDLPVWVVSGIARLQVSSMDGSSLMSCVSGTEDESWVTLIMVYFSCLHDNSCLEGEELQAIVQCFFANCKNLAQLPALIVKCLTFLIACSCHDCEEVDKTEYVEDMVRWVEVVRTCPLEVWYTHHPVVICWLYSDDTVARCLGQQFVEHWLLSVNGDLLRMVYAETDWDTHDLTDELALHELADNPFFLHNLVGQLIGPPVLASKAVAVLGYLLNINEKSSQCKEQTSNMMLETSNSLLHQLFLQDSLPQDYQVENVLTILTKLMTVINKDCSIAFNIKSVYHVVKYFGGLKPETDEPSVRVCLEYLLKYTEDRQVSDCLCVGPVVIQNQGFMSVLEACLTSAASDLAARLIAWVAETAPTKVKVPHAIHISPDYTLGAVTSGVVGIGAVSLLSASLAPHSPASPVVFSRDRLVSDSPLYTVGEIRTLYFFLQQLVCQESRDMFSISVRCITRLYEHTASVDKPLADYLSSHPWNIVWLENLLHSALNLDVPVTPTLHLLHVLCDLAGGEKLVVGSAETFLQLVLKTHLHTSDVDAVTHILNKCKSKFEGRVKSDLLHQVYTHLEMST